MNDDQPNTDEAAGPDSDLKQQNPGETTTADLTSDTDEDDPNKAEKLTKAGRDIDPNEGAD